MYKNLGNKPFLFPQPVMMIATYDKDGKANLMNAAWGGIAGDDEIMICLSSHKTTENMLLNKAFTVAPATKEYTIECDYVGIVSANKEPDKMKKAGFTTRKSEYVNAPVVNEFPLTLECEFVKVIDGEKYIGKIVNVVVDESILLDNGKIDMSKYHPIVFDQVNAVYYALGEKVGNAFSEGKKLK